MTNYIIKSSNTVEKYLNAKLATLYCSTSKASFSWISATCVTYPSLGATSGVLCSPAGATKPAPCWTTIGAARALILLPHGWGRVEASSSENKFYSWYHDSRCWWWMCYFGWYCLVSLTCCSVLNGSFILETAIIIHCRFWWMPSLLYELGGWCQKLMQAFIVL